MTVWTRIVLTLVTFMVFTGLFYSLEYKKGDRDEIVFCDVGQGDGFVVISKSTQIVFDGGPGSKMGECLARYVPVWDRTIEAMLATHPQKDHMEGQLEIFNIYQVKKVFVTGAVADGALFDQWKSLASLEKSEVLELARGDKFAVGDITFEVLWPTKSFIDLWKKAPGSDLNETSFIVRMQRGKMCAYLTGDITIARLLPVVDKPCQILKVSHHGSKTGTDEKVIELTRPEVAVIQVGAHNNYGHPTAEVLKDLESANVKVFRNDILGDIRFYFDGEDMYLDEK